MPLTRIFQLSIEFCLHFCLFEEHLLSNFIYLLLVFDLHSVTDSSYLFSRLSKITLKLFTLSLALLESLVKFKSGMIKLAPILISLFDF